jgi:coenzyme PQQ precursor peptide PqqA
LKRAHSGAQTFGPTKNGEMMKSKWRTPRIEEIAIGLEINSYACAEL